MSSMDSAAPHPDQTQNQMMSETSKSSKSTRVSKAPKEAKESKARVEKPGDYTDLALFRKECKELIEAKIQEVKSKEEYKNVKGVTLTNKVSLELLSSLSPEERARYQKESKEKTDDYWARADRSGQYSCITEEERHKKEKFLHLCVKYHVHPPTTKKELFKELFVADIAKKMEEQEKQDSKTKATVEKDLYAEYNKNKDQEKELETKHAKMLNDFRSACGQFPELHKAYADLEEVHERSKSKKRKAPEEKGQGAPSSKRLRQE